MPEIDLAELLGISRTPVRAALDRLQQEGLLVGGPRRGLVVAELGQEQVAELYSVRGVMEGLAARHAAQHASPAEIASLHELLERQSRTQDAGVLDSLNRLFHEVIHRASRNRYLIRVLDNFEGTLALLPGSTYSAPGRAAAALEEHASLVDAIERRHGDAAEAIVRRHILGAEQIRMMMISGAAEHTSVHRPAAKARPGPRARRARSRS